MSCPRCGHSLCSSQEVEKLNGNTIMDAPTLWVHQKGDIAAILKEVHRLDGLTHQLDQDRASLLRRVNNIQAATRRLPPEVLSTIFQFARPPIDFETRSTPSEAFKDQHSRRDTYNKEDDFQLVLGAVSFHWRQVVWTTPQLWTTISIEAHETVGESNVSLLNLYFENSRSLPMTVELDFRAQLALLLLSFYGEWQWPEETLLFIESIRTLFLNNAAKIRNFIVTGIPMEWTSLINKSFSRCESVMLYWPPIYSTQYHEAHLLDLTELPSLHHLDVKELSIPFVLPWLKITTLGLSGMPIQQCVESLAKCPNLVKFENLDSQLNTVPQNSPPSLNQPVVLEHLESLTWSARDEPWNSAFLRHMRFTNLRVLKWSTRQDGVPLSENIHDDFATFFSNLPETLQVLELADVPYGYQLMKTILTSIPHLVELVLNDCSGIADSIAVSMIGRPAAGLIDDIIRAVVDPNQLDGVKVLPRLRKLTILHRVVILRLETFAEMLEALHGAREMREHFLLELTGILPGTIWSSEVLARLKRLAESGFEFEILLDSQTLDYMSPSIDVAGCGPG